MITHSIKSYIITDKVTVEINIYTTKKFNPRVKKDIWGYIEIKYVNLFNGDECCFWDNIDFFATETLEEIKKECEEELKDNGLFEKNLLRKIKKEIDRIKKIGYIK